LFLSYFFFFFQAEDGIRDFHVTGVQTCALPIFGARLSTEYESTGTYHPIKSFYSGRIYERLGDTTRAMRFYEAVADHSSFPEQRSEERRVGKEGRCRWARYQ